MAKGKGRAAKGKRPTCKGLVSGQKKALIKLDFEDEMIWPLKWRQAKGSAPIAEAPLQDGSHRPMNASELLDTPRRRRILEHIWQKTCLSREQFQRLYMEPIQRFAQMVQQIPASQNHHHAYPGGMLDHGLEIVAYALKLRQSYLLPLGAAPEAQAAQADVWTAAIAYAALLHDLGKIVVDVDVILEGGQPWYPWHGAISADYRIRYRTEREYRLHGAAAGLVYMQILPAHVLDWLCAVREVWTPFIFLLAGQYEHAGILGELVVQADRASVAQELGANPDRAARAPISSLQRQLVDALRLLVTEQLKLNESGAADGWLTQDALWLVSKTVADKLRAHLLAQGTEGIPASNPTLFNLLQDQGLILPNESGKAIWKATVTGGSWQQTLTFIKLSPVLIWADTERPAVFSGAVTPGECDSAAQTDAGKHPGGEGEKAAAPGTNVVTHDRKQADTAKQVSELKDDKAGDEVELLLSLLSFTTPAEGADGANVSDSCDVVQSHPDDDSCNPVRELCKSTESLKLGASGSTLGHAFMGWLKKGVIDHKIVINDARAKVHTVAGTVFLVTPELFQRYAQEHVDLAAIAKKEGVSDWRMVQRAFEKLGLHEKRHDGLNIWTCEIKGPRKARTLKGYLLKEPSDLFATVPYDNPYLELLTSSQKGEDL
ncbi:TraI domain-containing protein [Pseudomonas sp. LJDD11]|nr:MobH family relaxase [Pseudomonas sp. LJDD11]MCQ9422344.1 TraI domain-containing protein [Pseudomonas sp. LJDD11]